MLLHKACHFRSLVIPDLEHQIASRLEIASPGFDDLPVKIQPVFLAVKGNEWIMKPYFLLKFLNNR